LQSVFPAGDSPDFLQTGITIQLTHKFQTKTAGGACDNRYFHHATSLVKAFNLLKFPNGISIINSLLKIEIPRMVVLDKKFQRFQPEAEQLAPPQGDAAVPKNVEGMKVWIT
jgi:hypothetical protein